MFKRVVFLFFISLSAFFFGTASISAADNPPLEFISQVPGNVYDVDVEGDFAYMATPNSEFKIVDVTDPVNPIVRGTFSYPDCFFTAIDVVETLGYVTQTSIWCSPKGTLHVFDVSSPDSPTEIGRTSIVTRVGGSQEMMVAGNYSYIANANGGLIIS